MASSRLANMWNIVLMPVTVRMRSNVGSRMTTRSWPPWSSSCLCTRTRTFSPVEPADVHA